MRIRHGLATQMSSAYVVPIYLVPMLYVIATFFGAKMCLLEPKGGGDRWKERGSLLLFNPLCYWSLPGAFNIGILEPCGPLRTCTILYTELY